MKKFFAKFAIATAGVAMAIGVGAFGSKVVTKAKAAKGDELVSFSSAAIVGGTATAYTSYSDDNWNLNVGGNRLSAGWNKTAANARQVGSTFAIDSTSVTSTTYGWVASTKAAISKAGKLVFSYTGGSGNGSGKLWLGYSTDSGASYSKVTLTSGTQGSSCGSTNTEYTFEFDAIDSAYYAIIVTGGTSGSVFRFDSVTATLYEGEVSTDPEIELSLNQAGPVPSTLNYSSSGYLIYANSGDDHQLDVDWSVTDSSVFSIAENGNHVGVLSTLKPGTSTLIASKEGYKSASVSITVNAGTLSTLVISGSMTKTSYYVGQSWDPSGLVVTGTYSTGYHGDVTNLVAWSYNPASPALNVESVVATATLSEVNASSAAQAVTVTRTNPIQAIYSKASGASVDVYGYYVGFLDGTGPVIMDGEYGIVVYNKTADVSGYTEGETILHVTGSVSIYNGLYEIGSSTISVASGTYDVPSAPVVYTTKGGETADYASRTTTVTGTGTVTSGSFDAAAGTTDIKMNFTVGANTVQIFYKKAAQTADSESFAAIKTAVTKSEEITIKGFTSWYNGFQVQMSGVVQAVVGYTAESFAQDLLDQTDDVCASWDGHSNNKSALTAIWSDLASADKYPSLPADQKEILANANRDEEGTVVEQAMARYDYLTGKYDLNNFINGRTPMANSTFLAFDNSNMTFILIASITSLSAIALLLVIRKKKQAR